MPIFVLLFLDGLNPVVRHVHGETIVKAIAAVLEFGCEPRHAADIFRDGDGMGLDFVNEFVGQCQIADGVVVLMAVEVVAVVHEGFAQTMAVVEHGGDAVKAEAIEVEFFQPVFAVGQQEVDDIVLAVVKAQAVPGWMFVTVAGIEELIGVAAEVAEAFDFVLDGMAMDDVHNNSQPHLVSRINEFLEFFRRAAAAARCEEGAYMIAKAAVIRMFLNGHNLDAVIAVRLYPRQDFFRKLLIGAYLFGILRHTYMTFIDKQRRGVRLKLGIVPGVLLARVPNLSGENLGVFVLYHTGCPGGNAFPFTAAPVHLHLV